MRTGGQPNLIAWAITFFLLSLVSAIFAFIGTSGEPGGLFGRVVSVGFLVIAIVMICIRRSPENPR